MSWEGKTGAYDKGSIDQSVLKELPPELLAEIESTMPLCERVKMNKRKRSTVNEKPKYAEISSDEDNDSEETFELEEKNNNDTEDEERLWRDLIMERVTKSADACLTAINIMTSPNMPKAVYIEDVIERVIQYTKFHLQNTLYPQYDPVYRVDPHGGGVLSSKAKRAKCSTHKQRVIVMLYNKVCDIVSSLSELLEIQLLTDTTILQVSSMGITPFFVENVSELQLCAIKLVTAVFSRYEKHRQLILEEIFTSLARLPTSKRSLRNFRLNSSDTDGEPMYIQMVTALVLQLIQCVVHLPSAEKDSNAEEESNKKVDQDVLITNSYETAMRTAQNFLSIFLKKCGSKQGEEDYRPLFENFIQDLLSTVNKPEWPAAELLLSLLGRLLVHQFSNKSTEMALRVASLDYLGTVAARLRKDAVTSKMDQGSIARIVKQLCGLPLEMLQQDHVLLMLGPLELDTVLQVGSHQCGVEGQNHLPLPAGHASSDAAQDAVRSLGCKWTLPAHVQLFIHQYPEVLLIRAALNPFIPQPVLILGIAPTQAQDPILGLVEPHEVHMAPLLKLVQVPLDGIPSLRHVNHTTQLGVNHKLAEGALDPIGWIIGEDTTAPTTEASGGEDEIQQLQKALLDYLDENTETDASLVFSRKFYIAQWFRDTTMETEKAIKSQKDEDSSEGAHHAKDVETTGQIMHRAESRKKFLRSIIKTAPSQFSTLKMNSDTVDYEDACLIVRYLASMRPFAQSFDIYLTQILRVLGENAIAVRTKAMKCLSEVVAVDPSILARLDMQRGVHGRLMDNSTSVREAAVELLGRFVLCRPQLAEQYYDMLIERILDTGISVRKRVIKILRDICIEQPTFPKITEMCVKMIRRVNDEEGIKKLVNETFQKLWFTPTPHHDKEAMTRKILNITDVLLKSEEDASYKPVKKACTQLVDNLVEHILKYEESLSDSDNKGVNSGRLVACITTLFLFSKIRPQLMVKHAMTMQPYLTTKCSHSDEEVQTKAIIGLGFAFIQHPSLMFEQEVKTLYNSILSDKNCSVNLKIQVLKNLQTYLQEEDTRMQQADRDWKKVAKQEDLKEMGDISSGMSSSIMQLYLKQVLEAFFHTQSSVRHFALNVIALTLNQGLIHPVQCVPYLIAMGTDPEPSMRNKADQQLVEIDKKYAGFIHMKAVAGMKMSYQVQQAINTCPKDPVRGFRHDESSSALCSHLYSMIRGNRQHRRAFLISLLNLFDDTAFKLLMEHLDPDEEEEDGEVSASTNARNKAITSLLGGGSPKNNAAETEDDESDGEDRGGGTSGSLRRSKRNSDSTELAAQMNESVDVMDVIAICCPKYKDRPQIARVVQKTSNGFSVQWMAGSYSGSWTEAKRRDGRKLVPWVDTIKESDIIYKKIALTSANKLTNKVVQTLRSLYAAKDGTSS
ncbi:nipped-bhypothetical protein [Limosa lapponica baueri]|uniref:Nipped-B protein n=1 Tax=Limosa lapponica baueri TaxID=1758121 RepID=A0A2I0TP47_LIMLA|nr:nipped-bhypothetical protein [Limosa lapponica baueri]